MSTTDVDAPGPVSEAVAHSPLFWLPIELRVRVFQYVFGDPPEPDDDDETALPISSKLGATRLTCHQIDEEARKIFFAENIHILNWDPNRVAQQPEAYTERVSNLDNDLLSQIKRIALRIRCDNIDYIKPLHLNLYPDIVRSEDHRVLHRGLHTLDLLEIVLDMPFINTNEGRQKRIQQEGRIADMIANFTHVNTVIVQNIFYRDRFLYRTETVQQQWKMLESEDESDRVNDDR